MCSIEFCALLLLFSVSFNRSCILSFPLWNSFNSSIHTRTSSLSWNMSLCFVKTVKWMHMHTHLPLAADCNLQFISVYFSLFGFFLIYALTAAAAHLIFCCLSKNRTWGTQCYAWVPLSSKEFPSAFHHLWICTPFASSFLDAALRMHNENLPIWIDVCNY